MSKSNALENELLGLLLNGAAIANLATNATASPLASLYVSLHTADPGEAGTQATSEATYPGYERVAIPRGGWNIANGVAQPVDPVVFPEATGGNESVSWFAVGVGATKGQATKYLYRGQLSAPGTVAQGVTPRLTGLSITED